MWTSCGASPKNYDAICTANENDVGTELFASDRTDVMGMMKRVRWVEWSVPFEWAVVVIWIWSGEHARQLCDYIEFNLDQHVEIQCDPA